MSTDTHIDLNFLLLPNPQHTYLVQYQQGSQLVWLVIDRSRIATPGELVLTAAQKLQAYTGQAYMGVVTYLIAPQHPP